MKKISTNPVGNYNYKRIVSFAMITTIVAIIFAIASWIMMKEIVEHSLRKEYFSLYILFIIGNIIMIGFCKYYSYKLKSEKLLAVVLYIYCTYIVLLSALIASLDFFYYGHMMIFIIIYFLSSIFFVAKIRYKIPVSLVSWVTIFLAIKVSERTEYSKEMYIIMLTVLIIVGYLSQLFTNRITCKLIEQQEQLKKECERSKILAQETETVNVELRKMAFLDPLTNLLNRRALAQYLERKLQVTSPLVCTTYLIDVDFFKQYNDHYGHPAGDEVLIRIGRALKDSTVQEDSCVARWGGEEFFIISTCSNEKVEEMSKRFVDAIVALKIENVRSTIHEHVTISLGAYSETIHTIDELQYLYERADEILYEAKRNGRNRYALQGDRFKSH